MNHYQVLEVAENASPEVVKAAYKSLMQRYHPDKNPGDTTASARAARLAKAYEVLSDPARRAAYDAEIRLSRAERSMPPMPPLHRPAYAGGNDARANRNPALWTSVATIVVVTVLAWLVWPLADPGKGPVAPRLPVPPPPAAGVAIGSPAAARTTMPGFVRDLRVELDAPPPTAGAASPAPRYVLTIPTIGIVVGNFDPDRYVMFMDRNRDDIAQRLAERLARASPTTLAGADGESRLKRLILDALAEITGIPPRDGRASPQPGAPPYGAVEALLPEGFTLEAKAAAEPPTPR